MQSAYTILNSPNEPTECLDDLARDIYHNIRAIPANIFRFDEYCNNILHKIRALPESHFPLAFVIWCKVMCNQLFVDNGIKTLNLFILDRVLNTTNDILYHPSAQYIYEDPLFPNQLYKLLQNICKKNEGRNSILAIQIIDKIYRGSSNYNIYKKCFMQTIKIELLEKAWHPRRIIKLLDAGILPDDM
jgi:hypothetical protein